MVLKNQKGVTLPGVMISFGILAVLGVGVMKLMDTQSKGSQGIKNKGELNRKMREISGTLSNPGICNLNFADKTLNSSLSSIVKSANHSDPHLIDVGSKIDNGSYELQGINIERMDYLKRRAYVSFSFRKIGEAIAAADAKRFITLFVETNPEGDKIIRCLDPVLLSSPGILRQLCWDADPTNFDELPNDNILCEDNVTHLVAQMGKIYCEANAFLSWDEATQKCVPIDANVQCDPGSVFKGYTDQGQKICYTPPLPASCVTVAVNWQEGGVTCSGNTGVALAAQPVLVSGANAATGATGTATYTCVGGTNWTGPVNPKCKVEAKCASTMLFLKGHPACRVFVSEGSEGAVHKAQFGGLEWDWDTNSAKFRDHLTFLTDGAPFAGAGLVKCESGAWKIQQETCECKPVPGYIGAGDTVRAEKFGWLVDSDLYRYSVKPGTNQQIMEKVLPECIASATHYRFSVFKDRTQGVEPPASPITTGMGCAVLESNGWPPPMDWRQESFSCAYPDTCRLEQGFRKVQCTSLPPESEWW